MRNATLAVDSSRVRAKQRIRTLALFGGMAVSVTLVGCGSDKAATPKRSNPTFTLSEFSIKLDQPSLPAGTVTLTADNVGAEEHEIIFVKASAVADLPTKADGSVDEEKIAKSDLVGEIGNIPTPGQPAPAQEGGPGPLGGRCRSSTCSRRRRCVPGCWLSSPWSGRGEAIERDDLWERLLLVAYSRSLAPGGTTPSSRPRTNN